MQVTNEDRLMRVADMLHNAAETLGAMGESYLLSAGGKGVVRAVELCAPVVETDGEREALVEAAIVALAADPGVPQSDGDAWTDVERHTVGLSLDGAVMWLKRVAGSLWIAVKTLDVLANPA